MKELAEFKNWSKVIVEEKRADEQLDFVWEIMKSPFIEYHYELLKDQNLDENFRNHLAFRFNEHKEAEDFLISKLDKQEDVEFQGEIIFLLGKINKKHKAKILSYARKLAESENDYTRDRAIIVLGWLGTIDDTRIFEAHLLNDKNAKCRAWSASSFMQMCLKMKALK